MTKVFSRLDRARDRYNKAAAALVGNIRRNMYKSVKKLTQEMKHEKEMVEYDLDDWVKNNPNFPLSALHKSAFAPKITWGKVSPTGQLDPIPHEFFDAHRCLWTLEKEMMESWKK